MTTWTWSGCVRAGKLDVRQQQVWDGAAPKFPRNELAAELFRREGIPVIWEGVSEADFNRFEEGELVSLYILGEDHLIKERRHDEGISPATLFLVGMAGLVTTIGLLILSWKKE